MPPRRGVRSTFFGATLPLYLVRLILVSSLVLIAVSTGYMGVLTEQDGWVLPAFFAFVFVHHTASLIKWRFFFGALDILFLLVEIFGCIAFSVVAKPKAWFPESLITFEVMSVVMTASLIILAVIRLLAVVSSRLRSLWSPVNVFSDHAAMTNANLLKRIFGRSMWEVHFAGETRLMRFIRGVTGIVLFALVSCFIMLNVIFKPMQETALSPVKEYQTSVLPYGLADGIELPTWNIVFVLPPIIKDNHTATMPLQSDIFFSAVNVTALWPYLPPDVFKPNCTTTSGLVALRSVKKQFATYTIRCGSAQQKQGWTLPDLVISVDFTQLIPTLQYTIGLFPQTNLPVILGLTNNTELLLKEQIVKRSLIPGMNIMSSVTTAIRETFRHPALAGFGVFQESDAFFFPQLIDTYPDLSISPLIPRGENISTLRLWSPAALGFTRTVVIQDYRENSVLAGLASVGGLWTTLGGIFVVIFGASLLRIMYGLKPLSLLGLAHSFQTDNLRKQWLNKYPKITTEHLNEADRGLLTLLRDHVIDIEFLDPKTHDDEKGAEDLAVEGPLSDIENLDVKVDDLKRRSTESFIHLLPLPGGTNASAFPLEDFSKQHKYEPLRGHE